MKKRITLDLLQGTDYFTTKNRYSMAFVLEYCSITKDLVDQSAFGLSNFVANSKDHRIWILEILLAVLLEHTHPHTLTLLAMAEEYEAGTSIVIEALYRFTSAKVTAGPSQDTLIVQNDNCIREMKKHFFCYTTSSCCSS